MAVTSEFLWDDRAEYLGFLLGPGACGHEWDGPVRKATDAVIKWAKVKCGMFFDIIACNVFILSFFGYIMQLAPADEPVKKFLDFMIRNMFVGPGNWLPLRIACALGHAGFKVSLRDLFCDSVAAKVRVAHRTELDLDSLAAECFLARNAYLCNKGFDAPHSRWHLTSMASTVMLAKEGATQEVDIGQSRFRELLQGTTKDRALQRRVSKALSAEASVSQRVYFGEVLRRRLERFRLQRHGLPLGRAVNRGLNRMRDLSACVKPAISGSYFKLLFNAWPTARRMRSLKDAVRSGF